MVIGIDEVGRGSWAGPVVVGAVALDGVELPGLTDSKLLSKKKRQYYYEQIKLSAPYIGIGWVSAVDIDSIGLSEALKLATRRALARVHDYDIEQIIIDGTIELYDDPRVVTMKKADLIIPSVSAASVVAKVSRDRYMAECDDIFPGYSFSKHVGYGSSLHKEAIQEHGVTPLHRKSFAPIAKHIEEHPSLTVKPTSIGNKAEDVASEYLTRHGYKVIDRNWRTKWCEIDIIAFNRGIVYFVEVKYRRTINQGGGVAAITPQKQRQMKFAAEMWLSSHGEHDANLSVIEVSGDEYQVTQFLESI